MSAKNLPPDLRHLVLKLLVSSKLVKHFANDLLDNSALESKKFVPILKFASIASIFQEVIFVVSIQAQERNLKIQADLDRIKGSNMKIDAQRFQQVLMNLLSNSIKFSHAGGVIVVSAWTETNMETTMLRVSVRDRGIGIAEFELGRIFTPFFKTQN